MKQETPSPTDSFTYLRDVPSAGGLPVIDQIRAAFGFVPKFFLAQTLRPDLIEAEVHLIGSVMVQPGALTRKQKEYIFLVCSAANLSTYCLTAHCEIVRMLGIEGPEPEQVAVDYTVTNLPLPFKALLNFAAKLNNHPNRVTAGDVAGLRTFGFDDRQILEAILMVGVANFSTYVSFGLGTTPDFDSSKIAFPPAALARA